MIDPQPLGVDCFTRARPRDEPATVPAQQLPTQQRRVLEAIEDYHRATGQACPAMVVARRLRVHHSTVQGHFVALYRKGWLRAPGAPAWLRRDT